MKEAGLMMKIKHTSISTTLLVWIGMLGFMLLMSRILVSCHLNLNPRDVLEDGLSLLVLAGLLHFWLDTPLFWRPRISFPRQLLINLLPLFYLGFLTLSVSLRGPLSLQHTLTGLAVAPVVALYEETLFRGYILESFLRLSKFSNVLPAVFWSSLLFGLSHLMNLARQDLPTTLYQVGFTFGLGALYAAIYLRTGSLWWPIVLHFANDFIVLAGTGSVVQVAPNLFTISFSAIEFLVELATVFWLLRPKQRKNIATHFQL